MRLEKNPTIRSRNVEVHVLGTVLVTYGYYGKVRQVKHGEIPVRTVDSDLGQ